ncbi:4-hydroxyphenylacetate 3-monooxygenase [Rhizobium chutanense]|uniref:4-hydroxyphenylacetate 3-monooxygenase n=1 Tax=Rhizobium chutanense TaxID=2035448 RepID=A0A2A6JCX1_9HYPH|nr:flavin reductase [Rhizobium chutanense]PDT03757.1 4-hydroxyphenylacetate 3-monooxygenase [Rhizobium chutanense]
MLNRQHIDPGLYRDAMSRYAGHVQLVTTVMEGVRRGVTITAACSVSDNPASVLICLNNTNPKNEIFFRSGIFVLNTLGAHHQGVADAFSGRTALADDARFGSARFETLVTGAPVLADALAAFDCRVTDIKEMPTHNVIFGEVAAVRFSEKHPALLYLNRDYHAL